MFTGIITLTKKPRKFTRKKESIEIEFTIPKNWKIVEGESININGICSTVKNVQNEIFSVYYMPETIAKTNLSFISEKNLFNFERSITLNDLLSGHMVSGHIDTTAEVLDVQTREDSKVLTFKIKKDFTKYMVYKGSVAVNGVSLTIVSVGDDFFTVSLIPYTLKHTNLGSFKKDDVVNIEVDMMAKYIEKLIQR